jgi:hypothetical protein
MTGTQSLLLSIHFNAIHLCCILRSTFSAADRSILKTTYLRYLPSNAE